MTLPEGLWLLPDRDLPCGMRSLFLWGLAIGKKTYTLCALSASVVKQSSKYPSGGSPAARDRRARY